MLDSLLDVLWYNGYLEKIKAIYRYINEYSYKESSIIYPYDRLSDDPDKPDRILWSVLVMEYGDYGTSPRCGWIESRNRDAILEIFKKWIDELEQAERAYK